MVTASTSANKFDAVSGVLEWEDLIILIAKPHKYPTVINMNVRSKDMVFQVENPGSAGDHEMARERQDPQIGMAGTAQSLL